MKTMSEENKENPQKEKQPINDLLMKPFSLGWKREVVRRVVTHFATCDIYYISPKKKKLRSLIEVKSNLTDGLSLECFSFKKEPLGLSPDMETVRYAKVRGKVADKSKEKRKAPNEEKKSNNLETAEEDTNIGGKKPKKKKIESDKPKEEEEDSKPEEMTTNEKDDTNNSKNEETEVKEEGEENNKKEETETKEVKNDTEKPTLTKPRRTKSDGKDSNENKNFVSKSRTRRERKPTKPTKPVKLQSVRKRKTGLRRVMSVKQAKQANVVPNKKTIKDIVRKKVASSNMKLRKTQRDKKVGLKNKKNSTQTVKTNKKPVRNSLTKNKTEVSRTPETNESDKKSIDRDLKSIVKKNIGKYREMREKQKLGAVKNQPRTTTNKLSIANIPRPRSMPISKNRPFYLKPIEKGWRRELVYRTNSTKAGQQADVYYFHPNGKKLRSRREIAENLTQGLSIECFTFRKEPLGCGEPSEVIRNARSLQKN